eukprot:scaffold17860_cov73-Phaeocystis_antarctica.AAC.3
MQDDSAWRPCARLQRGGCNVSLGYGWRRHSVHAIQHVLAPSAPRLDHLSGHHVELRVQPLKAKAPHAGEWRLRKVHRPVAHTHAYVGLQGMLAGGDTASQLVHVDMPARIGQGLIEDERATAERLHQRKPRAVRAAHTVHCYRRRQDVLAQRRQRRAEGLLRESVAPPLIWPAVRQCLLSRSVPLHIAHQAARGGTLGAQWPNELLIDAGHGRSLRAVELAGRGQHDDDTLLQARQPADRRVGRAVSVAHDDQLALELQVRGVLKHLAVGGLAVRAIDADKVRRGRGAQA